MRKLLFAAAIICSFLSFKSADAQLRIGFGININAQPDWGPVGYSHADYYYMPDIDAYYDVPAHQYVYYENNVWVHGAVLPQRYGNFDRYHSYKVVVNERNPWERHAYMRTKYAGYRGRRTQTVIRDSRDERYRNHYHEDNGNGHGNGGGRDHDRGNHGRGDNGNHGRGNDGDHGHGHGGGHGDH